MEYGFIHQQFLYTSVPPPFWLMVTAAKVSLTHSFPHGFSLASYIYANNDVFQKHDSPK
jgi:hypothetical protein